MTLTPQRERPADVAPPPSTRNWAWLVALVGLVLAAVLVGIGIWIGAEDATTEGPGPISQVGARGDVEVVTGSGRLAEATRDLESFDSVLFASEGSVELVAGPPAVTINADDNIIGFLESYVVDGGLVLRTTPSYDIAPSGDIEWTVGVGTVNDVELAGAGEVGMDGLEAEELVLTLSGAGTMRFDGIDVGTLEVFGRGAGDIEVSGRVDTQVVSWAGAGMYMAPDLESGSANIEFLGVGGGTVWVTEELEVAFGGVGSLAYYGQPSVSQAVGGIGTLTSLGPHE